MDSTKLSNHFNLSEFLHIDKYPDNFWADQARQMLPMIGMTPEEIQDYLFKQ